MGSLPGQNGGHSVENDDRRWNGCRCDLRANDQLTLGLLDFGDDPPLKAEAFFPLPKRGISWEIRMSFLRFFSGLAVLLSLPDSGLGADAKILDLAHVSKVFGEERNYRIFLPPGYD